MYKLPKDFDASFFVGKSLDFLTFSQNSVAMVFSESVCITVESSLQHKTGTEATDEPIQHLPLHDSQLTQLLGRSVTQAFGQEDGTLTIIFDNGHVLNIFDDQESYESYSIMDGKRTIYI